MCKSYEQSCIFTQPSAESVIGNVCLSVSLWVCLSVSDTLKEAKNELNTENRLWLKLINIKDDTFKKFEKLKNDP